MVYFHMVIICPSIFLVLCKSRVELHEDEFAAQRGNMFGESTRTGAYFHHTVFRLNVQLSNDPAGYILIRQKILTE